MATKGKEAASLEELERDLTPSPFPAREGETDWRAEVAALQAELARMKAQNDRLMSVPEADGEDFAGWIIRTPVLNYSGVTARVRFQAGVGLVDRDVPEAERLVRMLISDFGYQVQRATAAGMDEVRRTWAMDGMRGPDKTLAEKLLAAGV